MRFDRPRIELIPRSLPNCIDLAIVFWSRQKGALLPFWATYSLPWMLLVYGVAGWTYWVWLIMPAVWVFASGPFGAAVADGALRWTFGEPLRFGGLWGTLRTRMPWKVFLHRFIVAPGLLFGGLPGVFYAIRRGFMVETALLKPWHQLRHDHKTADLVRDHRGRLLQMGVGMAVVGGAVGFLLLATADAAAQLLFGASFAAGRLAEIARSAAARLDSETLVFEGIRFVFTDPLLLAVETGIFLLVYGILRTAWVWVYIDLRVRLDCWDLDLGMAREEERLAPAGSAVAVPPKVS